MKISLPSLLLSQFITITTTSTTAVTDTSITYHHPPTTYFIYHQLVNHDYHGDNFTAVVVDVIVLLSLLPFTLKANYANIISAIVCYLYWHCLFSLSCQVKLKK